MQEGQALSSPILREYKRIRSLPPEAQLQHLLAHEENEMRQMARLPLDALEKKRVKILGLLGITEEDSYITPSETAALAEQAVNRRMDRFLMTNPTASEQELKQQKYDLLLKRLQACEDAIQRREKQRQGSNQSL